MEEKLETLDVDLFLKYCEIIDAKVSRIAKIRGFKDPMNQWINWEAGAEIKVEVSWSSYGCTDSDTFYVSISDINKPDEFFEKQYEEEKEKERLRQQQYTEKQAEWLEQQERKQYEKLKAKFDEQ